jgi:hypothetical protein
MPQSGLRVAGASKGGRSNWAFLQVASAHISASCRRQMRECKRCRRVGRRQASIIQYATISRRGAGIVLTLTPCSAWTRAISPSPTAHETCLDPEHSMCTVRLLLLRMLNQCLRKLSHSHDLASVPRTSGNVKLLLPPRQSRGNSHFGLAGGIPETTVERRMGCGFLAPIVSQHTALWVSVTQAPFSPGSARASPRSCSRRLCCRRAPREYGQGEVTAFFASAPSEPPNRTAAPPGRQRSETAGLAKLSPAQTPRRRRGLRV